MDPNDFHSEVAGKIEWSDNGQFCYFKPNNLPFEINATEYLERSFKTMFKISKLDGRISGTPEEERFILINSFSIKEATTSSAIEGSRSTVSDIFKNEKEKEKDMERAMDNLEVMNYKNALMFGIDRIKIDKKITSELILSMHDILLQGVRGKDKQPGHYRNGQVWVGSRKDTVETAEFVPVPPYAIPYLMDNLLEYMNGRNDDPLKKIALAHYQFETIHPFKDGNGRIGRLLIMLLLHKEGIMDNPFLYLSEYFNRYRNEYIGHLTAARTDGSFEKWLDFFLDALDSQSKRSMALIDSLESYRGYMRELAVQNKSGELDIVCGMLMRNPYITTADVVNVTGVSPPTARKLIGLLVSKGILEEVDGKRKGALYKATAILEMLENV